MRPFPGKDKELRPVSLIVNADDYGYSEEVSRGILDAAGSGVVTATGILANSPFFEEHVEALRTADRVDPGVHLNLTVWRPLTSRLARLPESSVEEGTRSKTRIALSVLSGRLDIDLVEEEWDAQIRRCIGADLRIWFLNSHEHLHMLPPLFRLIHRLADRHGIPYIRYPSAEWFGFPKPSALARELTLLALDWINGSRARRPGPALVGVSRSGRIDLPYLEKRLATLREGGVYELMCHPGHPPAEDAVHRKLLEYHDWKGELDTLVRAKANGLFHSERIRLIGFRDLNGSVPRQAAPASASWTTTPQLRPDAVASSAT